MIGLIARGGRVMAAVAMAGALWASPAPAAPAGAVVGNGVPGSCDEGALDTALAVAGAIAFNCGGPATIAISTVKTIAQDTTLSGGDVITLTGGFSTRLFVVNSGVTLQLAHMMLDEAASTGSDGGAIANHGRLVVDHSTIQRSQTDSAHSGGAIFSDGPVTITDSLLANNSGGSAGALFANLGQAVVTVRDSTFRGNQTVNSVTGFGGAIWVGQQARLTLSGGTLLSNTAHLGGGIYVISGTVDLANTTLSHNAATQSYGGGIDNEFGALTVSDTSFISNTVPGYGGGVENGGGQAHLTNVIFRDNAAEYGGGIDSYGGGVDLTNVTLISNTASDVGGGLAGFDAAQVTVSGGEITGNRASYGGGIENFVSTLTVTNASLSHNTVGDSGGGLDSQYGIDILSGTTFFSNTAPAGFGGGLVIHEGAATLTAVSLSTNSAKLGGGLYHEGGLVIVIGSTVSGSSALYGSGKINKAGGMTLLNSTLNGNAALKDGGAVENENGALGLVYDTLSGNSAFEGGGLYEAGGLITESISVLNTIMSAGARGGNCFNGSLGAGVIVSHGYNLSSDTTCASVFTQTSDLNHLDPLLGPLANNGGPTLTHLPGLGSPAIDAIPAGALNCGALVLNDQRGFGRPFNGRCDSGAVETGWVYPQLWLPLARR